MDKKLAIVETVVVPKGEHFGDEVIREVPQGQVMMLNLLNIFVIDHGTKKIVAC